MGPVIILGVFILLLWTTCGVLGWHFGKQSGHGRTGLLLGLCLGFQGVIAAYALRLFPKDS